MIEYTIYKFYYKEDLLYIGSTKKLKNRMADHKHNLKNEKREGYNFKLYKHLRLNKLTFKDITKEIYSIKVNTKKEATTYEEILTRMLKPLCNTNFGTKLGEEQKKNHSKFMSIKMTGNNYGFKGGCILFDNTRNRWKFSYYINFKPKAKYYPVKKYGYVKALVNCFELKLKHYSPSN